MWLSTPGVNSMLQPSPLRKQWGGYARFVYAFLLAVVFPFICWGQSGQAAHPHPRSHFVFAPPPELHALVTPPQHAPVAHNHPLTTGASAAPIDDVAGQSIPASIALFSLLLVYAFYLWLLYRPVNQKHLFFFTLGTAQNTPAPCLPPPRTHQ